MKNGTLLLKAMGWFVRGSKFDLSHHVAMVGLDKRVFLLAVLTNVCKSQFVSNVFFVGKKSFTSIRAGGAV